MQHGCTEVSPSWLLESWQRLADRRLQEESKRDEMMTQVGEVETEIGTEHEISSPLLLLLQD